MRPHSVRFNQNFISQDYTHIELAYIIEGYRHTIDILGIVFNTSNFYALFYRTQEYGNSPILTNLDKIG